MKTVKTTCQTCKKKFAALVREVNRGNAKYCSRTCFGQRPNRFKVKESNCKCSYCNEPFYRSASKIKASKSGMMFCNRKCKESAQKSKSDSKFDAIRPNHYGASSKNYRKIAFENYEMICTNCGYDKYPQILEVHHIDRDRDNNSLSNLRVLCPTCHQEEHYLAKDGRY